MRKYPFETKIKRLEEIVALLEEEITDLDSVVSLFQEGLKLSKELTTKLRTMESKIETINENDMVKKNG